jgi:hypothetical protein
MYISDSSKLWVAFTSFGAQIGYENHAGQIPIQSLLESHGIRGNFSGFVTF